MKITDFTVIFAVKGVRTMSGDSLSGGRDYRGSLFLQMLLCSFLWATAFLLLKIAGTNLSPLALTAVRGIMGGVLLAAWIGSHNQNILPRGREWKDWVILGVLQGIVPNTLTAYALTQISAGLTSMIQATTPLIVAVLAQALFADERLTKRRVVGLLTGFSGMMLLIAPAVVGSSNVSGGGMAAMLAVAVSYALGNLYVRAIPTPQPLRLAYGQQLFSGLPTFVAVWWMSGAGAFAGIQDSILTLAVLGVFGTALPIVLYMRILSNAGPTVGSMNGYFLPPWTILLGAVFLGEAISVREITATAVVLLGVMIVSTKFGRIGRISSMSNQWITSRMRPDHETARSPTNAVSHGCS
jgi:drug/metabolite transporter (DMT)-like permease